eukprot:gnl/TRDRNA2_/TRDRNA2_188807_c0_seq1.p1 gnl/TRDRNA2_/TRDRNA2_188807_c0~~gnl/TRDRNA2_/TRDRNA2_188807_c0_seq1.p1  ORF type:complete len:349 (+),score=66.57 gnl/TRDRNA2_/TRDRNA2_188807_c0_seq1:84-1130(+)
MGSPFDWGKGKGMGKMQAYMMSWMGMGSWAPTKGKGSSKGKDDYVSEKTEPSREEYIRNFVHKKIATQAKSLSDEALWHLGKHDFKAQFDELDRLLAGGRVEDAKEQKDEFKGFAPSEWLVNEFVALKRMTLSDESFKNEWDEYCTSNGHKMYDLKFHEHNFVFTFVTNFKASHGISEIPGLKKRVSDEVMDQFKDMQRGDYNFKMAWEEHIGPEGKRDPRVHTDDELVKFIADYTSNSLPGSIKGKDTAQIVDTSEGSIVSQLKLIQRNDLKAKELWGRYCYDHGCGKRDPAAHPEAFVKTFVDAYNTGNIKMLRLSGPGSAGNKGYGKGKGKGKGWDSWDSWWSPY